MATARFLCLVLTAAVLFSCTAPFSSPELGESAGEEPAGTVSPAARSRALDLARAAVGSPYEWAADGPGAFDCSGLIVWAYQQATGEEQIFQGPEGLQNDITMDDLYAHATRELEPSEIERGDIVFITYSEERITHGGLFLRWESETAFSFVHASSYHGEVVVATWPTEGTKRSQWFAGAGRLLAVSD